MKTRARRSTQHWPWWRSARRRSRAPSARSRGPRLARDVRGDAARPRTPATRREDRRAERRKDRAAAKRAHRRDRAATVRTGGRPAASGPTPAPQASARRASDVQRARATRPSTPTNRGAAGRACPVPDAQRPRRGNSGPRRRSVDSAGSATAETTTTGSRTSPARRWRRRRRRAATDDRDTADSMSCPGHDRHPGGDAAPALGRHRQSVWRCRDAGGSCLVEDEPSITEPLRRRSSARASRRGRGHRGRGARAAALAGARPRCCST